MDALNGADALKRNNIRRDLEEIQVSYPSIPWRHITGSAV